MKDAHHHTAFWSVSMFLFVWFPGKIFPFWWIKKKNHICCQAMLTTSNSKRLRYFIFFICSLTWKKWKCENTQVVQTLSLHRLAGGAEGTPPRITFFCWSHGLVHVFLKWMADDFISLTAKETNSTSMQVQCVNELTWANLYVTSSPASLHHSLICLSKSCDEF